MLLLLLFQVGGYQSGAVWNHPNWNYRSMCEPIHNFYLCNYDTGQCCLPGAICRNQYHFFWTMVRHQYSKERAKFCKCAASAPERSGTNFKTFRNGNFGPPLWAENASKLHIKPYEQCLKITEKVSFNNASEASYIYILSGQKCIKKAQNGQFW